MKKRVKETLSILAAIGMPRGQLNERSALCLLAACDLKPNDAWSKASTPLIGITPIMEFAASYYRDEPYAPNTRETIRRQSMHQFCSAGITRYNPDKPDRPVNSPAAVYQLSPEAHALMKAFGSASWEAALAAFRRTAPGLADKYAAARNTNAVPLTIAEGRQIDLSPGAHSELIAQIVSVFGAHFAPAGNLVYVGDTGRKWGYFDDELLSKLGVQIDGHGKMPDVVIYIPDRNWLLLCEAVTSHGPVNAKRHNELQALFAGCSAGLVFVTAFPTRKVMPRYCGDISWETEVWCADNPTHLIHFNGSRFLGPY